PTRRSPDLESADASPQRVHHGIHRAVGRSTAKPRIDKRAFCGRAETCGGRGRVHDRPRPSSRAQIRQGNNTRGSALLRRKNRPSYSPSHFSSVTKPAPFFRLLTSVTIGAASLPNV